VLTLRSRISGDIRVSQVPRGIFLYATSPDSAVEAEQAVRDVMAEYGVTADFRRDQWNPIWRSWSSHEVLMKAERKMSAATGRAAWLVHVASVDHRKLRALARRLEDEGIPFALRWTYLVAGASCEDDAYVLADQIRGYGPGARIRVQPGVYEHPPVRVWIDPRRRIWF
jgi:hypothetical protein